MVVEEDVGGTKHLAVSFPTGKEVLDAYWGFLSNGGLVLSDAAGLQEGDSVLLDVTILSSNTRYSLNGQVVRGTQVSARLSGHAVVAFDPGEPHDLLLSAAWAETDNVPPRRHRRVPTDVLVKVREIDGAAFERKARLMNVSLGGCCIRLAPEGDGHVKAGDRLELVHDGSSLQGVVRWARVMELGLEFDPGYERTEIESFVRRFHYP